ncbi:outer membrane beta-barrel protein [Bradyrhizobium oligotrophicum]|uniref:outer membrane beta-barrel protein n=1 Tax=Bradyrhizobium oligotrophicum TaxID=44255 RepID=UPI003EBE887E
MLQADIVLCGCCAAVLGLVAVSAQSLDGVASADVARDIGLPRSVRDADPGLVRRVHPANSSEILTRALQFTAVRRIGPMPAAGGVAANSAGCLAHRPIRTDMVETRIWRELMRCAIRRGHTDMLSRWPAGETAAMRDTGGMDLEERLFARADRPPARGFRIGNFVLKPSVELTARTAVSGTGMRPAGPAQTVGVQLGLESQFERHALNAELRVAYMTAQGFQVGPRPRVDARVNGRYDLNGNTALNGQLRYAFRPLTPGMGADNDAAVSSTGATIGFDRSLGAASISVAALLDRSEFMGVRRIGRRQVANSDRNFIEPAVQARLAYALTPEITPFVDLKFDRRGHDLAVDFAGRRRDSTGTAVAAGAAFAFPWRMVGEVAVGYIGRNYEDPRLPGISGLLLNAGLVYRPFGATEIAVNVRTETLESIQPRVSGILRREASVQLRQPLNDRTRVTLSAGIGRDVFVGIPRIDDRYFAGVAVAHRLTREVQIRGDVRQEWIRSSQWAANSAATIATLGVRFQY